MEGAAGRKTPGWRDPIELAAPSVVALETAIPPNWRLRDPLRPVLDSLELRRVATKAAATTMETTILTVVEALVMVKSMSKTKGMSSEER
jgi:hypothetical protein